MSTLGLTWLSLWFVTFPFPSHPSARLSSRADPPFFGLAGWRGNKQAAGLIPLAHASAGPYLDIILPHPLPSSYTPSLTPPLSLQTGFHALTPREFAGQLERIFEMTEQEREGMRKRARESVRERFGNEAFQKLWEMSFERLRKRVAAA